MQYLLKKKAFVPFSPVLPFGPFCCLRPFFPEKKREDHQQPHLLSPSNLQAPTQVQRIRQPGEGGGEGNEQENESLLNKNLLFACRTRFLSRTQEAHDEELDPGLLSCVIVAQRHPFTSSATTCCCLSDSMSELTGLWNQGPADNRFPGTCSHDRRVTAASAVPVLLLVTSLHQGSGEGDDERGDCVIVRRDRYSAGV